MTNRESIFDEGQTVTDTQKVALANYIQPAKPKKDTKKKEQEREKCPVLSIIWVQKVKFSTRQIARMAEVEVPYSKGIQSIQKERKGNTSGLQDTGYRSENREQRAFAKKKCPSILFVVIYKFARPFVLCIVLCYLRQKYAREVCGWMGIAFHSALGVGVCIKTRV